MLPCYDLVVFHARLMGAISDKKLRKPLATCILVA